ncbi:MAG: glutamate--tRNA ligase [Acidobacteria bacterium]|nr:MAG: glutamate--tRNA ligase [Acidobacteriota bacterium]
MNQKPVRVRFAPSPTGHLHVGGARTALFNWLYARNRGGKFILRIEDTDQARSTLESEKMVKHDLRWLGMDWDEGPEIGGDFGPYRQSERMEIYKKHAEQLLAEGKAYRCFCTDAELTAKREQAEAESRSPHYDGTCLKLSETEIQEKLAAGVPFTIRFKVPDNAYTLYDMIRGAVHWEPGTLGDFIILRSDGMPVYNFCVVVDDHLMEISHVIRAEEHLPNTLRQIMLYEAFGWKPPKFAHASLILGQDRSKLSKRHGATSVGQFKEEGYLSEAMVNYLALLGWNEGKDREEYTIPELIKAFSVKRINNSPAVFDMDKLNWLNGIHLRKLTDEQLFEVGAPFLVAAFPFLTPLVADHNPWILAALNMEKNKMVLLSELGERLQFLFHYELKGNEEMRAFFAEETHLAAGRLMAERILAVKDLTPDSFWEAAMSIKEEGFKGKALFHPLRALLTGTLSGPELNAMVPVLVSGANIPELVSIQDRCRKFIEVFGR